MRRRSWPRRFRERADLIVEWQEAEVIGRIWKARYIRWVLGPSQVVGHVGTHFIVTIVKKAISMFKAG